jgi:prophage regulatory protein
LITNPLRFNFAFYFAIARTDRFGHTCITRNAERPFDMQKYLTFREVCDRLGGRSRYSIYNDLRAGRLPRPLKLGNKLYWPEEDLEAFLRQAVRDKRDSVTVT